MSGLVLLASYPKSGNTWLRAFLSAVWNGGAGVDINDIRIANCADRGLYDQFLGMSSSDYTFAELNRLRSRLYAYAVRTSGRDLYLKVHDAWLPMGAAGGLPLPQEHVRAVLYLVRDPRDVAVSFAQHMGKSLDETIKIMAGSRFRLWTKPGERWGQLPQLVSSWSEHVGSWLGSGLSRVLLVRYEDMHTNQEHVFQNILRFLGIECRAEVFQGALASTSFSSLEAQERVKGFRERPPPMSTNFFRKGVAQGWRGELTDEQAQRIVSDHGVVMKRLGYAV